jgi:hypothetical protein
MSLFPRDGEKGVTVRINLSSQQKEVAKACGISEEEYAQQFIRLIDEKLQDNIYRKDHRGFL